MIVIAVDPGPVQSAILQWDGEKLSYHDILTNEQVRTYLDAVSWMGPSKPLLAVEMVASYGMPVGREVFETVLQIGRLQELASRTSLPFRLVYRLEVKQHLCHDSRAKDSNIRQALIDRFGPPGTKKAPGRLYGIKSHLWSALAIAVFAHDNPL